MPNTRQKITLFCPECDEEFDTYETPQLGQKLTCPHCWAALEFVSVNPPVLQWETVEEDPFPD
jgi:lysine biosynthesis protein LysW